MPHFTHLASILLVSVFALASRAEAGPLWGRYSFGPSPIDLFTPGFLLDPGENFVAQDTQFERYSEIAVSYSNYGDVHVFGQAVHYPPQTIIQTNAYVQARLLFGDTVSFLSSGLAASSLSGTNVVIRYKVTGGVEVANRGAAGFHLSIRSASDSDLSLHEVSIDSGTELVTERFIDIEDHLSLTGTIDAFGRLVWGSDLSLIAFTPDGLAVIALGNTIRFESIEFADGTTPESHGYNLQFDSGITSPNLRPAAVPEPTSLALLGTGLLGLVGYRSRRRGTSRSSNL